MTEKTKKRIGFYYSLILSVSLLLTAVLFIASCISIYRMGDGAFTTENIGKSFGKILIPVIVAVALTVGGAVISIVLNLEGDKLRSVPDSARTLQIIDKRLSLSDTSDSNTLAVLAERNFRRTVSIVITALYTVGTILSLFYVLDPDNYGNILDESFNPNRDVLGAALAIIICLAIPFIASIVSVILFDKSRKREIAFAKKVIAGGAKGEESASSDSFLLRNEKNLVLIFRVSILALSFLFILLGAFNGGYSDVLSKAVKICQECIGIG